MHITNSIRHRYTEALFQVACKQGLLERVQDDCQQLLVAAKNVQEFVDFLKNPLKKTPEQKKFLKKLQNHLHALTFHFCLLLARKKRLALLITMMEDFLKLYASNSHRIAYVTTACPISQETSEQLLTLVSNFAGYKGIEIVNKVDPAILGGYILHLSPYTLDASLRTRTRQLLALWRKDATLNI